MKITMYSKQKIEENHNHKVTIFLQGSLLSNLIEDSWPPDFCSHIQAVTKPPAM